jgi:hypothetical protein
VSELNLPAGCTQAQIDHIFGGEEIRCGESVNGKHCNSEEFQALITCEGEFMGGTCGYKYAVAVQRDGGDWVTVGSPDCKICGYDDNPRTGVVCTRCGNDAPEFCTDCGSIPCHCNPFDPRDDR